MALAEAASSRALAQLYAPAFLAERAFENLAVALSDLLSDAVVEFRRGLDERWPCAKVFHCDPVTRTLVAALPTGVDARTGLPRLHFLAVKVNRETNFDNFLTEVLMLRREVERVRRERLYAGGCALAAAEGATYIVVAARGYARGGLYVSRASREFALCYVVEDSVDALRRLAQGLLRWLEARLVGLCRAVGLGEAIAERPVASIVELLKRELPERLASLSGSLKHTLRQLASLWGIVERRLRGLRILARLHSLAGSAAALVRDVGDAFTSLFPSMRRLAARWYHLSPAGFLNLLDSLATA